MRIAKVVRRKGGGRGGSPVNAVIAATIGDGGGGEISAGSRQHVEIVQRDGRTEVRESSDHKEKLE